MGAIDKYRFAITLTLVAIAGLSCMILAIKMMLDDGQKDLSFVRDSGTVFGFGSGLLLSSFTILVLSVKRGKKPSSSV